MTQQERRNIKPTGRMWVSEGGQSDRWVWRLSKGIKVTRADLLLLQGKRKGFWDGKK